MLTEFPRTNKDAMPDNIRFAVAGLGHIGRRHAQMILEHPQASLVGIADINPALQEAAEGQFHTRFFSSLESLLDADVKADVMVIATPNGLHASQAVKALQHQCHVVIEKPMALTTGDCNQVIAVAQQQDRKVFCVMQNRYSPPAQWLKQVVRSGLLGQIYLVEINCYWNRDDRYYLPHAAMENRWKGTLALDGGPLFTQFSHFIDMMYWLFGDIRNVKSRFINFNHRHSTDLADDSGLISFELCRGGIGSFHYSTAVWDKNLESSMTIIGEHGSIKVGGQYMDQVTACHIKDYVMPVLPPSNPPNDYGSYKGSAANHHFVIQNVIDTLTGLSDATTNAEDGMRVVDIIERMYAAG